MELVMTSPWLPLDWIMTFKAYIKSASFLLIIFSLASCQDNEQKNYPPNLIKAIDLFYLENNNDEVIKLINELDAADLNTETKLLSEIFKIAAICENGKVDSASALIAKIDQKLVRKNPTLNYYFNSINGLILFRTDKYTESYATLVEAINYPFGKLNSNALSERILARISLSLGDYTKGIDWLISYSSRDFYVAGLTKGIAINHKILGRYYMTVKNFPQAILSFKNAEKGLLESKDELELFYVYINLIDYYISAKEPQKALHYAKLCMQISEKSDDNRLKTLVYNNMGEIELQLKNYTAAINYFNKTINAPTDYVYANFRHTNSHIQLSQIYKETHQYDLSLYQAKLAVSHLEKNNVSQLTYEAYKNLAECFYNSQSVINAYKNLDTAYQNMDSVNASFSQISKAYSDSKVELVKASYKMQQLAENERKQRLIIIGVSVVLVILLIFAYFYIRLINSRNSVLKVLVKKNLQIFEEERKSIKSKLEEKPNKVSRKFENEKSDILYNQFLDWLDSNNNSIRKDLTLEVVAKEMNTNRDYLSRAINDNHLRFTDIINRFRVLKAIEILSDKKNPKSRYNLSIIANEVGFNSNSVFIEAFRKQTGMNPAQFRDNLHDRV